MSIFPTVFFLSVLQISHVFGALSVTEEELVASLFANNSCKVRDEFHKWMVEQISCEYMMRLNPICSRNITVVYFESPPYVTKNARGLISGIIPAYLEETLLRLCCLNCNAFNYVKTNQTTILQQLFANVSKSDIILPVETTVNAQTFLEKSYINLFRMRNIVFLGKNMKVTSFETINNMIIVICNSWPLLITALIMTFCAGIIIWLLETWANKKNFPRAFPRGPFEGLWWAYVSMTTVGYGDRTPTTVLGRLFAMCWIFVGIVIFNMFTANLTSALTATITGNTKPDLYNKTIGVLKDSAASKEGVYTMFGVPQEHDDINDLLHAFEHKAVEGIALVENTFFYHKSAIENANPDLQKILSTELSNSGMGLLTNNMIITKQMNSLLNENEDCTKIFYGRTMEKIHKNDNLKHHSHGEKKKQAYRYRNFLEQNPFSTENTEFLVATITLAGTSILFLSIGCTIACLQRKKFKRKNFLPNENISLYEH